MAEARAAGLRSTSYSLHASRAGLRAADRRRRRDAGLPENEGQIDTMRSTRSSYSLALSLVASLLTAPSARAADATVPGTFATVQAALNGAVDADNDGKITIQLGAATFTGAFLVARDNIELVGAGATTILRAPTGTAEIPVLSALLVSGFEVRDLTIRGSAFKPGLDVSDTEGLVVENVRIELASEAAGFVGCNFASLSNLTVIDCGAGILLRDSIGIELTNSTFTSNDAEAVLVRGCTNTLVSNIVCSDNLGAGVFVRRSTATVLSNVTSTDNLEDGLFIREVVGIVIDNCTLTGNGGFGVFTRRSIGVDFDGAAAGVQGPVGTNTITGNSLGVTN
ncbi:MAG: right-handed parallel beta-helix repeat-containing protein [Planctomycetes bacterium]|nr:right-handed parallel beta-helix repeat-containing protein [Planctomycetota bacterium]